MMSIIYLLWTSIKIKFDRDNEKEEKKEECKMDSRP